MNYHKIAIVIANELFVNGQGDRATHLRLYQEPEKYSSPSIEAKYLGGWCYDAAVNHIEKCLYSVCNSFDAKHRTNLKASVDKSIS